MTTILTTKVELKKEAKFREASDKVHSALIASKLKDFWGNPLVFVARDGRIGVRLQLGCYVDPKLLDVVEGPEECVKLIELQITKALADASAAWEAYTT